MTFARIASLEEELSSLREMTRELSSLIDELEGELFDGGLGLDIAAPGPPSLEVLPAIRSTPPVRALRLGEVG